MTQYLQDAIHIVILRLYKGVSMILLFSMLLSLNSMAYESGEAPFCAVDEYGNMNCFYYSLSACREAITKDQMCSHR